ncbi:hypothetical protein Cfor_11740, partial [Coptotermes formosanus]
YLDFDNLPDTNFSCEGKVIGGYYADVETGCQMFHVCTIGQKGETTDIKFLCLNGTVFDQETRVCERVDEVDCSKTEGFYNLNLELYGNNAAVSFPEQDTEGEEDEEEEAEEEGEEEETESEENTETSDTSSNGASLTQKVSTSKPPTPTPSSPNPITAHPPSTTTPKTPVHPFVPTTTYKSNPHLTHFHSTTTPSIAAFLAINNAFSSSTSNQEGSKFGDNSSHYDEDEVGEEDEEEEEEDDSTTDRPGIVINGGTSHHFPVTTVSSQIRPVSPGHHNIPQHNVKVHGTGESGVILSQSNRQQPQKSQSTSTHSGHLYGHQTPLIVKDTSAHSKHQLNTQFILNQQRNNENKQHHGFTPIPNPDNKNQFLFSSTTRQPPVLFTTKSPGGYSAPAIESFSHHAVGTQPPLHVTQRPPNHSPLPPQTNAHQVPPNPLVHQIRANIANNGGFLSQTIQISQNPLTFQFNSNGNNRQLFTTPSVAVVATTSSTSSSSSARTGSTGKVGNISPVISLTSSIGNTPKGSGVTNNSSVSVQLFTETAPPNSYDEYQEGDVHSDPFFRDVPKIAKPSTSLKTSSSTRHRIVRKKREALKNILVKPKLVFLSPYNNIRYKRKAVAQTGLPTEAFGTGKGRYRSRSEDSNRSRGEKSSLQTNAREQIQVESHSRRTSIPEKLGSKQNSERSSPSPFVAVTYEVSTIVPKVLKQAPHYSGTVSNISLPSAAPKRLESTVLSSRVRAENHQGYERTSVKVTRPYKQNVAGDMYNHHPLQISGLPDHTESFKQFVGEESSVLDGLLASTSGPTESNYEIPKPSAWIGAEISQTLQNITKDVPIARTHGRGEHRHLQHQPSQSNLGQEGSVGSHSRHSGQRSRQKTRMGATGSAHENDKYLPRRPLTFQTRGDTNTMKTASRIADNRYSDSKNVDERTFYRHHASPPSRIRNYARKLDISNRSQDVARSDSNKLIHPTSETQMESDAATEPLAESPFHPQISVPKTNFSCADKIPGGYYADLEADCQLFHICSMGRHGKITDNMFLCGPGTRFDQRSRICQTRDLVDCSLSASLYYLNSHFQLNSADGISTRDASFESQKIRTRRETIKELPPGSKQPHYNIDNLPETSFTCGDKPQDGLYADVETQCQVFHLCRTISGQLTLESSFVCPPGTVFNQPEGNCDIKNEVDCALYSAPEHTFKKTETIGIRNQDLKSRHTRHTVMEGKHMKLNLASPKKDAVYKHVMHKNYRMKRDTNKETFDYYDYVDDNYEAHAVKPKNRDMSPADDRIKPSKDNTANSEDYDSAPASADQGAKEDLYLFKSQKNEKDGQKYIVSADEDQRNKGPASFESSVAHTTEGALLHHKASVAAVDEITSVPIPYQLVLQNKSARMMGDKLDYVYEYEYDDEDRSVTSALPDLKQTSSAADDKNIKNYMKSITLDPRYDVENSYNFSTQETSDHIRNDAKFATVTHQLVDNVPLATSTTESILEINKSGKITTNQNLEAKVLEKVDSANGNVRSEDYEYEYYYDEDYTDSNETEADSSNKYLPSVKTEDQSLRESNGHNATEASGDKRDGSAHYVVTEEINPQVHRPSVEVDNISDTRETINFNLTFEASEELNVEPPAPVQGSAKTHMSFGIDVAALNKQQSTSTERAIISELFETNINPSPSGVGGSIAYVELSSPVQVEESLSQHTQRTQNLTSTEVTLQNFSAQIPSQSTSKSMLQPLKSNNIFRNRFSTLVPPLFVFQSREKLNSIKSTTERNAHTVATNFTGNNVRESEGKPRTPHRFGLEHIQNHMAHIPEQMDVNSSTTALATYLFVDDPVTDDKEARSQNTVPSTRSSEMSKSEQNSSTDPHLLFSSNDDYKLKTDIPLAFAKSSKISADTVNKLIHSKNEAAHSSSGLTDSISSSELPMFPYMGVSTPSSSARYDSHNLSAVNSSVATDDNIMLKHFRADNSSLDHAFRNIFQLSRENTTSALVFSINNLAVPLTTTSSAFDIPSSEPSEVLPNTSPSSHLGYTLSAVTSQPSVSADTTHTTGFLCTGRELHRYHPDTDDCRMFHYCSPGFHERQVLDFRFICQNGTAFRADTHKCENEFLVPTCVKLKCLAFGVDLVGNETVREMQA